jgi:HAD superfamily hydrolase (TIGR01509 family)
MRAPLREVLLFDYDGVLADTEPLHWASWKEILVPFGIDLTWEQYSRNCRGVKDVRMPEVLTDVFGQIVNLTDLSPHFSARKRRVSERSQVNSPIPAKTVDMLRKLDDWRLGLVTSAEREDIEPILRNTNILNCFEACVFGGDVTRHKPAPDPYLEIASRMGTIAGIAFEDSESGMISAREAGFRAVRISDPADLAEIVAKTIEIMLNTNGRSAT